MPVLSSKNMGLLRTAASRLRAWWFSPATPGDRDPSLDTLQDLIGHRFADAAVLRHALTHKSAIGGEDPKGLYSNERLEFLGDAVLNCLVTEHLYARFPKYSEGQLSKMKSLIVSRKIIGEVAASIALGRYLVLGASERKSGGQKRKSIMSNAFEAVLGAMYLDGGLRSVRGCLKRLVFGRIDEFLGDERNVNHKSTLLELAQRDGFGVPRYTVLSTSGPEHAKRFTVGVEVAGVMLGEGRGSNKKIAQQNAAQSAIVNYSKSTILSHSEGESEHELLPD
ncbi:MAG: ribonuclease III [Chitinivibrionales bacterium]|nr:ribonuclease III [Chitinivibrionales bacterium]MBD3395325.1 ribonuclease III [Chitinivibrionales bacterium]